MECNLRIGWTRCVYAWDVICVQVGSNLCIAVAFFLTSIPTSYIHSSLFLFSLLFAVQEFSIVYSLLSHKESLAVLEFRLQAVLY